MLYDMFLNVLICFTTYIPIKKHVVRHVFIHFNKKNQQISGARNYPQSVGQIYKNQQLYIVLYKQKPYIKNMFCNMFFIHLNKKPTDFRC